MGVVVASVVPSGTLTAGTMHRRLNGDLRNWRSLFKLTYLLFFLLLIS